MRQTSLHLSEADRKTLVAFRSKGRHLSRELNRAHILAALDQGIAERQIITVLGVGRTAIWRTRSAYGERGLQYALQDVARPGKPRQYTAQAEAEITALACSAPPAGAKRWTIRLLRTAVRTRPALQGVSRETIRRFLKKTSSNPGGK